jgi:hypothetical protein
VLESPASAETFSGSRPQFVWTCCSQRTETGGCYAAETRRSQGFPSGGEMQLECRKRFFALKSFMHPVCETGWE